MRIAPRAKGAQLLAIVASGHTGIAAQLQMQLMVIYEVLLVKFRNTYCYKNGENKPQKSPLANTDKGAPFIAISSC